MKIRDYLQMNSSIIASNNPKAKISWFDGYKFFGLDFSLILLFIMINAYAFTFINGVFWDDWVIYQRKDNFYFDYFRSVGTIELVGYLHHFFQSVGVWLYKVVVITLFFISLILFGIILEDLRVSESLKKVLLICLIIFPLFESRYLSINIFYVISITAFLFGFLQVIKGNIYLAQPFFLVAYINNSYILIVSASILIYLITFKNVKKVNGFLLTIFFATLFVIVKYWHYSPYGAYEGYNKISLYLIGPAITKFLTQLNSFLNWLILEQGQIALGRALTFLAIGNLISYFCIAKHLNIGKVQFTASDRKLFFLFLVITAAGLLPYFMVGKTPYFYYDYGSRHFSGSFIGLIGLVGGFIYFLAGRFSQAGKMILTVIFGLMITINLLIMDDYRIDNEKSRAIIEIIKGINGFPNQLVIVQDDTGIPWAARRTGLSFYEWGGIFRTLSGDNSTNWNFFIYDSIFWSGEGCSKASGLYRPDFSADISNRENNLATLINLKLNSDPSFFTSNINLSLDVKKNIEVCRIVCDECGFSR